MGLNVGEVVGREVSPGFEGLCVGYVDGDSVGFFVGDSLGSEVG